MGLWRSTEACTLSQPHHPEVLTLVLSPSFPRPLFYWYTQSPLETMSRNTAGCQPSLYPTVETMLHRVVLGKPAGMVGGFEEHGNWTQSCHHSQTSTPLVGSLKLLGQSNPAHSACFYTASSLLWALQTAVLFKHCYTQTNNSSFSMFWHVIYFSFCHVMSCGLGRPWTPYVA